MSTAFNITKGRVAHLAGLPGATDSLIVVPLEATDLVADSVMRDYDTLAAILAGASNEQTTAGRKTLSNVSVTVDDSADTCYIDADDFGWTGPTGNNIGGLVICYKPASDSEDSAIEPLGFYDWAMTCNGADLLALVPTGGFYVNA